MSKEIKLTAMPTPNPNTIKFLVDKVFFEKGSIDFPDSDKAKSSPLPKAIFKVSGIDGVMIGTNFISITKEDAAGWDTVLEPSSEIIKDMISSDNKLFDDDLVKASNESSEDDNESITKIKQILDNEIRPAIGMDGGDCEFVGYEDGILTLKLQGACSNCPSSVMTLKMGIESRLREEVPDLKEVIQL
tara:strand:+ start:187 stop:750 length:564 start_codon:yes stop_codon:yes gene_type:complete